MRICVSVLGRLAEPRNGRPARPWGPRPGPGGDCLRCGGGAPPRALRGTRSDGPREQWSAVGQRPAMPDLPCTPEAGAVNGPASADVAGHWHRFRLGMDQPGYLRLLRFFASFARAGLHASVTRRAAYYGFHPQLVSIRPGGQRPPALIRARSSPPRACESGHRDGPALLPCPFTESGGTRPAMSGA